MSRAILFFFIFSLGLISCQQGRKDADFKGVWLDKTLLEDKNNEELYSVNSPAPFPLILFEENVVDSVIFYYNKDHKEILPPHQYTFQSYFFHFDQNNEYFFVYDYKTDEMVLTTLAGYNFSRFVKPDKNLTKEEIMDPNFDLDSLIQTVR